MVEMPESVPEQKIREIWNRMPRMRRLACSDDERDGIELFGALLEYLDQLCGPGLPDRPLSPSDTERVARLITAIRLESPAGPPTGQQDQHGAGPEVVRRLDQPVNAGVTVAQGRRLAERLAAGEDWQAALGEALIELYACLDQVHGGSFTELLNSTERRRVAAALSDSAPRPGSALS